MILIQSRPLNPNVPCRPGWCLTYVQDVAGIPAKYPSAIASWNASKYKHHDQDFPAGLWVPLWFSLRDNPYGHVVWREPNGSVWSSSHPTNTWPVHHPNLQHLLNYYSGRLTYLGWTEDVQDTLIIKEDNSTMNPTEEDIKNLGGEFWGVPVDDQTAKNLAGKTWPEAMYFLADAFPWKNRKAYYGQLDLRVSSLAAQNADQALEIEALKKSAGSADKKSDAEKKLGSIKEALDIK